MATEPVQEKRFDVVIFDAETRTIDTIAGTNLPLHGSFHTVYKRLATVNERINDRYRAKAVEAGKYKKGDVLPPPEPDRPLGVELPDEED